MWAVLDIAYRRLSLSAQLLLPYLAAFKLPFSREQIMMLVAPQAPATVRAAVRLEHEHYLQDLNSNGKEAIQGVEIDIPTELARNWRAARDELVDASFIQFDGRVYTIHAQVRHFALSHLPQDERRRVHRVMATYYSSLPQPGPDEWFAAFEHLEDAGEAQDLQKALHLAVRASWALHSRGYASELRAMLRRAETYALDLGDKPGEVQVQYCLGSILRRLGKFAEALGCLTRSLTLHREQNERDEEAWALYELAMLFREEGHYQQAGQHAKEALTLFSEAGDSEGEAWMHTVLGEVGRGHGYYNDARSYYNEATAIFNSLGDRVDLARVLNALGAVSLGEGEYLEAKEHFEHALAIAHEQEALQLEGRALRGLGDVARAIRQFSEADRFYNQAVTIITNLDTPAERCAVLHHRGELRYLQGQYREALADWVQALTQDRRLGHPERQTLEDRINTLVAEQHLEEAYAELRKQLEV